MANPVADQPDCELSDILVQDDAFNCTVNTKFLLPGDALPVMEPSGEMDVRMTIPLREFLQEVEHSGCTSGRARPIPNVAENCSTNTITQCPREFTAREQPTQPNIPGPLRTNYPPTPPAGEGFLSAEQQ